MSVSGSRRLVVRRTAFLDRLRPDRRHRLQGGEKLAPRRRRLPLAVERSEPLVRLAIVLRVQSLCGAQQLRQHRRRRSFLRHRQRAPELLELSVHLAEASHVLARLEGLRQLDADHLLEPLQVSLAALLPEKLAPEKPALLELVLDRLPFFGVPGEAAADLLRKLGGALLGLLRE